ncbi:MAG TPA: AlkA N-terminal domain-containing protein [Candidatus Angelobacter sp.]|nr:AlkA N-terminal domain-containing protein [Candidatus Angelobacter sp.]
MALSSSFTLPVQTPFDWESLFTFLRARATPGVETVTDSAYQRTIGGQDQPQTLNVTYDHENACLRVDCSAQASGVSLSAIEARVRQIFKADVNTSPIEKFLGRSPRLANFVRQQPGLRVPGGWSSFEIAVRAVLGQQISVPAATMFMGRLVRLAGTQQSETAWLFPTAAQVVECDLGRLGVPRQRQETLRDLAAFFAEHGDGCVAQPDIKEKLLRIKGIGKWTAGYILMRSSQDHDYWPEGDLVLRKALSNGKTQVNAACLEKTFNQWSPYRGYATIHIWRGYVSSKNSNAAHQ